MESFERENLEVDVLFVGAGPASLAGALKLRQLVNAHNETAKKTGGKSLGEISIAVIEKGREVGAHMCSGAVMDIRVLKELLPNYEELGAPLESIVTEEDVSYLTATGKIKFPIIPPPLNNHGKYVVSLNKLIRWLGPIVEAAGVDIYPEFPGTAVLYDNDKVIGVQTGDKGIGKDGELKDTFEPGGNLLAKVTVFGEGARGSLTKKLVQKLKLDAGCNPQIYSTGVKEIWELPKGRVKPGFVMHALGYPLPDDTYGGSFAYGMQNDLLDIGLVVGLDYRNPHTDPHRLFQQFKQHPAITKMLASGKMLYYGAKTIPMGGYFAQPKYYGAGFCIIGDSAGFLNSQKLKGIHLGMQSGIFAAEAIFAALLEDKYDEAQLRRYYDLVESSYVKKEMYEVRNFHQAFEKGRMRGLLESGLQYLTGGSGLRGDLRTTKAGHEHMQKISGQRDPAPVKYDNALTFDKLTDVYRSGTEHTEDQPSHLHILDPNICLERCL